MKTKRVIKIDYWASTRRVQFTRIGSGGFSQKVYAHGLLRTSGAHRLVSAVKQAGPVILPEPSGWSWVHPVLAEFLDRVQADLRQRSMREVT